ncbi:MAG: DUF1737 domain-containing protein [Rhodoluna sp.]
MTTPAKTPARKPAAKAAAAPSATRKPVVRSSAAASAAAKAAAKAASTPVSTPDFTKHYKMLTGIDDSEFCTKVGLHLDNGYELYGSPTSTFNGKNVIVGQAVVLKKVPAKKKTGKKK